MMYGDLINVRGKPDWLVDGDKIMTHEVTRGWGSRAFERTVGNMDWKPVFAIRMLRK